MREKKQGILADRHTIRFKINTVVLITAVLLTVFIAVLLSSSMNKVECDLIESRLMADINCMTDGLVGDGEGRWSLRDGALYIDDTLIGDGSIEGANADVLFDVLHEYERMTGTFFYIFLRTYNDDELVYVDDGGYWQGHYLRVTGTTRGPNGERIEGTYIDKKVADAIEASPNGVFTGKANVNGRPIYCRYELIKDENGENIGILSDGRSIAEMKGMIRGQQIRGLVIALLAAALLFWAVSRIFGRMSGSIEKINSRLATVGTGFFPEDELSLHSGDELDEIADSINEMTDSLRDKAKIERELSEKKFDLQTAASIQQSMLPKGITADDRFAIHAFMRPAKEVGGDFYDYALLDPDHVLFTVADVSGKGIPAALFMMRTVSTIRSFTQLGLPVEEIFRRTNDSLVVNNEDNYFVTAWLGVLDLNTGRLDYVNAGHNPPVIRAASGEVTLLRSGHASLMLGTFAGIRYRPGTLTLSPGDSVFVYTDGVTEANDADKAMFKEERMLAAVTKAVNTPESICGNVLKAVEDFSRGTLQFDDITMLNIKYTGGTHGTD